MITTISLVNIHHGIWLPMYFPCDENFLRFTVSNFQIYDTLLLTVVTMLCITSPGFILSLFSYIRCLYKRRYGELGAKRRPIQEIPERLTGQWVCVDSDERGGLETVLQSVSQQGWADNRAAAEPLAPLSPSELLSTDTSNLDLHGKCVYYCVPLTLLWWSNQTHPSGVVYGLFVVWEQDCSMSLCAWWVFWYPPGWNVIYSSKPMDPARLTVLRRWLGLH